jgi:hypothetical protein
MSGTIITVYGIACIVCAIAGYLLARSRRRSSEAWAVWGFLFPPSLAILLLLPSREVAARPSAAPDDDEEDDDVDPDDLDDQDADLMPARIGQQ